MNIITLKLKKIKCIILDIYKYSLIIKNEDSKIKNFIFKFIEFIDKAFMCLFFI